MDRERISKLSGPALLVWIWVAIGIVGIVIYAVQHRSSTHPAASFPIARTDPVSVTVPTEPTAPATGIILDAKIAVNVQNQQFESLVDARQIMGAPTPLGLAVNHTGYQGNDTIDVDLFSNDRRVGSCARYVLNSEQASTYWCQFPQVPAGPGYFRTYINGVARGRYDFIVRPIGADVATTAPGNALNRDSSAQFTAARPQARAPKPRSQSQSTVAAAPPVTCILPSGQEVSTSRQSCRQQSGVIY